MYYQLHPENPARLGMNTTHDKTKPSWVIKHLHLIFFVWYGGDFLQTSLNYYISENLFKEININSFTGISFIKKIEVEKSEIFKSLYPNRKIPNFYYLKIHGMPTIDDIGITQSKNLIVSNKFLETIKKYDLSTCKVTPINRNELK